jgi:hypothetical protein
MERRITERYKGSSETLAFSQLPNFEEKASLAIWAIERARSEWPLILGRCMFNKLPR